MTGETIRKQLGERLDQAQANWLDAALAQGGAGALNDLLRAYTDASKHLGRAPLTSPGETGDTGRESLERWTLEDAGRLLLLLTRHQRSANPEQFATEALTCFEQGDTREQVSWMRAVSLLPTPERYLPIVIDTCRTNILPLFEAVACDNPYPARFFPERNFNQMVLKAMFNGVKLARIQGLAERANAELTRMANDYADERRAAGRSIPADIALATTAIAERNDR